MGIYGGVIWAVVSVVLIGVVLYAGLAAIEDDEAIERQVAEDTCKTHGMYCCSICFDFNPFTEGR
jgi:hypothetical protein